MGVLTVKDEYTLQRSLDFASDDPSLSIDEIIGKGNYFTILYTQSNAGLPSFPNPLTPQEETAVLNYIGAEQLAGNSAKTDSFGCFKLFDEANALWDWKRNVTMINNGATKVAEGFQGGGANRVNNNLNNNTFPIDQVMYEVFINSVIQVNESDSIIYSGAPELQIRQQVSNPRIQYILNRSGGINTYGNNIFANDTLYALLRDNTGSEKMYKNGVSVSSFAQVANLLVDATIWTGTATCVYSSLLAGNPVGFDHVAHNTNLRALLTALS